MNLLITDRLIIQSQEINAGFETYHILFILFFSLFIEFI